MVCYRRYGHNEGDEPAFTQPRMYEVIGQRRSVRKLYTELLVNRGDLTLEDAEQGARRLPRPARRGVRRDASLAHAAAAPVGPHRVGTDDRGRTVDTGVPRDRLEQIVDALVDRSRPASRCTRSSQRIIGNRRKEFDDDQRRLGARRSARVRLAAARRQRRCALAGQDTRRGTFSQRHAVLVDHVTEEEYTPLAHLGDDAAPFMIYDSVLSEFAALGFEYGYSVADRDALVCWEAQFGDFGNGAQTIIDQFIVAAEDKWGQRSGLVMLLPHGFEGQGPEHSSARLERFLVLCADDNIRVVYPTTAAQYFHVLRRQVHDRDRKPLVVMTPKRYLRMPATVLAGARRSSRARSSSCSPTRRRPIPRRSTRLVFCTGKFGARADRPARRSAGARRDRPRSSSSTRGPSATSPPSSRATPTPRSSGPRKSRATWAPATSCAAASRRCAIGRTVGVVARPASPSPASGSSTVHDAQQQALLEEAVPSP